MAEVKVLLTARVGQLTGSTDQSTWPLLVDAEQWPLLNDTSRWGALGVDLGANTEHSDGRLYIFFGDTTKTPDSPNEQNADLVAWTDAREVLRHGGHLAQGWNFILPNKQQGATETTGQPNWRFCAKCHGIFWSSEPDQPDGVCHLDKQPHQPIGWEFVLPNKQQGATEAVGQPNWRFCNKCHGLFWSSKPDQPDGVCPLDNQPHQPIGWEFVLPNDQQGATEATGQPNWRFCNKCHGLFWDGDAHKGICTGSLGGGFHLNAVLGAGHLAQGWNFVLPNKQQGATDTTGQPNWRFCAKCHGIFWSPQPDQPDGICPLDNQSHQPIGWEFVLPNKQQGATDTTGQPNWRFCAKCHGIFWAPQPDQPDGICPLDNQPHQPIGWEFVLPNKQQGATEATGQPDWRFCSKCHGLFWDGEAHKGICPGARDQFAPFTGTDPIGQTLSLETPNGAFSYAGKVWVFAGFSEPQYSGHTRPGNPAPGCYLTSKAEPDKPGPYQKEFLFSPQIGWCPHDATRDRLESHEPLGLKFFLSHSLPEDANHQANYRRCRKCQTLFWDGNPSFKGHCHRGGSHEAEASGLNYVLLHSVAENDQTQSNWCRCEKCESVYWNGAADGGLCPAGGEHQPTPLNFVLRHQPGEGRLIEGGWRYCIKCHSAVWTGQEALFSWVAPCVVQNAQHPGLPQTPHEHGLVMFGFFYSSNPGIRLAWMPLKSPAAPMLQDILYYTGNSAAPWSSDVEKAVVVLPHTNTYTHLSAAWLAGPQRWILLYSNANDERGAGGYQLPAVARIGTSLWDWSDEIEIFNPITQEAYGKYMHEVGSSCRIHPDIPPQQDPTKPEHDGWA